MREFVLSGAVLIGNANPSLIFRDALVCLQKNPSSVTATIYKRMCFYYRRMCFYLLLNLSILFTSTTFYHLIIYFISCQNGTHYNYYFNIQLPWWGRPWPHNFLADNIYPTAKKASFKVVWALLFKVNIRLI